METLCFYLLALLELLGHRSAMGPKKGISAKPSSVQLDAENENRDNKFSLNQLHSPWKTFILVWSDPSISSTSKICWLSLRTFTFLWIGLSISATSLKLADCLCFWYFLGFDFLTSWHNLVRQHECKSGYDWFMVISYFPSVTFLEFQGRKFRESYLSLRSRNQAESTCVRWVLKSSLGTISTLSFTVLFAQLNCLSNSTSYPTNFKHLVRLRFASVFFL